MDVALVAKRDSLSLFKLPGRKTEFYLKWKTEILSIFTRDKVVDPDFKALIKKDKVYICERHFNPEDIEYTSKYIFCVLCICFYISSCSKCISFSSSTNKSMFIH